MRLAFCTVNSFRGLLAIVCCLLSFSAPAQEEKARWLLGTGITYCSYIDNPGLNLNITYRVIDNLHVGPDFSVLLTREREDNGAIIKRKELEYNFNANYLLEVSSLVAFYPLLGINLSKITNHPMGQEEDIQWVTGLNTGGGFEFGFKSLRLFVEGKWVSKPDKYDLTAGLLFEL